MSVVKAPNMFLHLDVRKTTLITILPAKETNDKQ